MNDKLKELIQYCRECIAGKINCCTKHKHACIRFLKDYEATKKPGSKFIYKWDRVEHVIKWASLFKHTKGILTGEPIILDISQVFIVANIYGFYYSATGYRRFQKFYYQVGRKNAKSQLLAVILSYELMVFTGGGLAEIYCAATKRERSQIVYNEIKAILQGCKLLTGKWKELDRFTWCTTVCRASTRSVRWSKSWYLTQELAWPTARWERENLKRS